MRDWLEETHSTGFELRRHFFRRFFDSDLVSTPGHWRLVAGGLIAVLLSSGIFFLPSYFHKYQELNNQNNFYTDEPLRLACMADVLFLVTLSMVLIGLLTTMQWPSLFPSLRDYLALASLPIRTRELFVAKFSALVAFAVVFVVAFTFPPSLLLPMMMAGPYAMPPGPQILGIFAATSLGALFVFFALIATQGVLLNILPIRQFQRISLAVQAALLTVLLCGSPLVFSISGLYQSMTLRPAWAVYAPPLWFLGIHQVINGNREPLAVQLAWIGLAGAACAAVAAIGTYLWSYRRHKIRLLETPSAGLDTRRWGWPAALMARLIPNPRELAIFAFIGKTLARSRQHRLVLSAFAALAVALIFESFVSLVIGRGFRGFFVQTPALRQAVISAPLALSLFVLAGFRYLFRLPVELRANWLFRINEPGNRLIFLAAVEKFLIFCAVAPVALLTLPLEMVLLGPGVGFAAAILCVLPSLTLMEVLLLQFDKIPFTSSYLPGQRPVVQTLLLYGIAVALYVTVLSAIVGVCLKSPVATLVLFAMMVGAWVRARKARLEARTVGKLEFEEVVEPAVHTLSIERD